MSIDDSDKSVHEPVSQTAGGGALPPGRTAVGAGNGGEPAGFDPKYDRGEEFQCKIIGARPGGYGVIILHDGAKAFLKTSKSYSQGVVVSVKFSHYQDRN